MLRALVFRKPGARLHCFEAARNLAAAAGSQERTDDALVENVTIEGIEQETPTVKRLTLKCISDQKPSFKPGQWVDFHIPGTEAIGGFSITSRPSDLIEKSELELAVKRANYPPARWVHEQAKVGDAVRIEVGGKFHVDDADLDRPLLLVAGGIGITPLISILTYAAQHWTSAGMLSQSGTTGLRAALLYSAPSPDEFAFLTRLEGLLDDHPTSVSLRLFVTSPLLGSSGGEMQRHCRTIKRRRIAVQDLAAALASLRMGRPEVLQPLVFVCGPPSMTEAISNCLLNQGLAADDIRFERWW